MVLVFTCKIPNLLVWSPGFNHCDWGLSVSLSILEKFLKTKGPNIFFVLKVIGVSINLLSVLR